MLALQRPQLRPYLEPVQDHKDPDHVYLVDRLGLTACPERLTVQEFHWLRLFDGCRNLRDIQSEAMRLAGGGLLPLEIFASLAGRLNDALFLDSPVYRSVVDHPVRPPRCIGCYEGHPGNLRRQLQRQFTGPKGPGLPRATKPDGHIHAALIPHIDYPRGGQTYAWAFKEIVEHSDASLFVIIGTSHYSNYRFTLTRKDFETPLGIVKTDQEYIDKLVRHYGPGLFDDELMAHLPEHSIELEVVFLQYLYGCGPVGGQAPFSAPEDNSLMPKKVPDPFPARPIRIVPLVVGSFFDCIQTGEDPARQNDIAAMIGALRRAEAETNEPICYIISGDLAHIGPKFGDADPVDESWLARSFDQDQVIVRQAENVDMPGYFRVIAEEADARRICGLPPTYTLLEAIRPKTGKLLHYDRYVHPKGHENVSFASIAYYK